MELFKCDILNREYKNFCNNFIVAVIKCNYCNKTSAHKKFKFECNQCRQLRCRNCMAFNISKNYLMDNLDAKGKSYLSCFICDFLNISDESLRTYCNIEEKVIENRTKNYKVQTFRKSEKYRAQTVYQELKDCEKIYYMINNRRRTFYKK